MEKPALRKDTAIAAGAASVGALAWRHRGVLRVTVVAKATFAFAPDAVMPRVDPQPIFAVEVNHGNNPTRSTRFSADVAPYLERAEIFFTGHAYAPGGHPLETVPVRLGVFAGMAPVLDKMLLLRQKGGFLQMPLVYERAYGGIGWPDNPLGVGALAGSGEPTIFDSFDDRRLAGFGPIGGAWIARRGLLGSVTRRSLEASFIDLPDDFDFSYFQAALPDQRVPFLGGDEWIVMDGLHPTLPRVRLRLPGARGLSLVYGLSPWGVTEGQPLALHADTLRIDGDEQRCTLTFRGVFPVAGPEALAGLRVIAGVELPGEPIAWPRPEALPALESAETSEPQAQPVRRSGPVSVTLTEEDFESVRGDVLDGTLALAPEAAADPAMPFRPGPAADAVAKAAVRPPPSQARPPRIRATLPIEVAPDFGPVMPFRPAPAPPFNCESTLASELEPEPPTPTAAPEKPPAGSPWAPAPVPHPTPIPPAQPAPRPDAASPPIPVPSPQLKKGLYGRFGGKH